MPPFLVFLARHAGIGFAISAGFVGAIVLADPAGLGTLLTASREHPVPLALLWFFAGLTFGGVQMAVAITLSGHEDTPRPSRGRLQPIPLRVERR
ncbi:hypothetical protein ACI6QG_01475 [Roseococcus sp. DSY-14]|uniref:hypothetical protein n=1 Tax=Roseococcus sp. DSY-14 TaxID=3369650 RepID=UPI00387B9276